MNIKMPQSGMSMLASTGFVMPQESMLEIKKRRQELYIGIPNNIKPYSACARSSWFACCKRPPHSG